MRLPPHADDLIEQVLKANPNTVVVMQSGSQCEMPWFSQSKAVLQAFYGGNECGSGIASVVFGEVSGACPFAFGS